MSSSTAPRVTLKFSVLGLEMQTTNSILDFTRVCIRPSPKHIDHVGPWPNECVCINISNNHQFLQYELEFGNKGVNPSTID